jgi:hypothetical protein
MSEAVLCEQFLGELKRAEVSESYIMRNSGAGVLIKIFKGEGVRLVTLPFSKVTIAISFGPRSG